MIFIKLNQKIMNIKTTFNAFPKHDKLNFVVFRLFCLLFIINSCNTAAQTVHSTRWMGEIEGKKEVVPGGGAFLYDLNFVNDSTLVVRKSTGINLIQETFHVKKRGAKLQIQATETNAIPEFSNAEFIKTNERRYDATLFDLPVSFRPSHTGYALIQFIILFALMFFGNELCRKYKYFNHILFIILPIVLIPHWLNAGFESWFRWVKLYSAITGSFLFMLFRFHGFDKFNWMKYAIAGILAINISEAVIQDLSTGQTPNLINGIAGILNILTISHFIGIKRDENKPHDMLWPGMTVFWILAYDVWNIVFVYLNFPNTVYNTIAVILAPTVAAIFIKKGTWLQARANTLSIYMMYLFTTSAFINNDLSMQLTLPLPRNEPLVLGAALLSITANVALAFFYYRFKIAGRAPANIQIGQSESVI
jgi:hypothetical protein